MRQILPFFIQIVKSKSILSVIVSVKQSIGIKKQCADAIDVADKKLEAAEERRDKQTNTEETQADPDDVKAAKESGTH